MKSHAISLSRSLCQEGFVSPGGPSWLRTDGTSVDSGPDWSEIKRVRWVMQFHKKNSERSDDLHQNRKKSFIICFEFLPWPWKWVKFTESIMNVQSLMKVIYYHMPYINSKPKQTSTLTDFCEGRKCVNYVLSLWILIALQLLVFFKIWSKWGAIQLQMDIDTDIWNNPLNVNWPYLPMVA